MTDKAEYRVEMFQHRKRVPWKKTLDVSDVFHDDALTIQQKANIIADRLALLSRDEELLDLADELRGEEDAECFDHVWSRIYDWADYEGVWIKTV